ncbi:hypothetical protein FF38_01563 [Lucilia cuprina]|uniref:Uncharacterized protein n=1 Tax=Lucilia cuprina TaxID=7375 RepID=A0A0L0CHE1_LUCCU|nr:hypothetical protein FF38_01563 [Lucilia cuprina]
MHHLVAFKGALIPTNGLRRYGHSRPTPRTNRCSLPNDVCIFKLVLIAPCSRGKKTTLNVVLPLGGTIFASKKLLLNAGVLPDTELKVTVCERTVPTDQVPKSNCGGSKRILRCSSIDKSSLNSDSVRSLSEAAACVSKWASCCSETSCSLAKPHILVVTVAKTSTDNHRR